MANNDNDKRNSGFINLTWEIDRWKVGGSYIDENGIAWDLGWFVTSPAGLSGALDSAQANLRGALAKKGIRKTEQTNNGQRGRGNR